MKKIEKTLFSKILGPLGLQRLKVGAVPRKNKNIREDCGVTSGVGRHAC